MPCNYRARWRKTASAGNSRNRRPGYGQDRMCRKSDGCRAEDPAATFKPRANAKKNSRRDAGAAGSAGGHVYAAESEAAGLKTPALHSNLQQMRRKNAGETWALLEARAGTPMPQGLRLPG